MLVCQCNQIFLFLFFIKKINRYNMGEFSLWNKMLNERWQVQIMYTIWFYLYGVSKHAKVSCALWKFSQWGVILGGGEDIDWKGAHWDFWSTSATPYTSHVISILICVLLYTYRVSQYKVKKESCSLTVNSLWKESIWPYKRDSGRIYRAIKMQTFLMIQFLWFSSIDINQASKNITWDQII